MSRTRWMYALVGAFIAISLVAIGGRAQGHGRGHDKDKGEGHGQGKGHEKHEYRYSRNDRDEMRLWYREHENNLPPGLAKRDRLPPGLERQLRVRGTLPPGLRDRMQPVPEDFLRLLPPPPPECEHTIIGGRIVLVNRSTWIVLDIFNLGR